MFFLAGSNLKRYYWRSEEKRSLWGDGKFIASVGHITLEKAKEYVENQKTYYAKKNINRIQTFQVVVIQII